MAQDKIAELVAELLRSSDTVGNTLRVPPGWSVAEEAELIEQYKDAVAVTTLLSRGNRAINSSQPLSVLGDFRIIRELGRGGMGVVYLAEQLPLGRKVAVKVLRGFWRRMDRLETRLAREATNAAKLSHPAIVRILSYGFQDGSPYYAMEYVPGTTLSTEIDALSQVGVARSLDNGGLVSIRARLEIIRTLAAAVAYAHEEGVAHRDIKAQNVIIKNDGRPCLIDFGLSLGDRDPRVTRTDEIVGTPYYLTPEAAAERTIHPFLADTWALGVLLYRILTLAYPFDGKDTGAVLAQIRRCEVKRPSKHHSLISKDLDAVCIKSLSRLPRHRYSSVSDFLADIDRLLKSEKVSARPLGPIRVAGRHVTRHRVWYGLGLLLLVVLIGSLELGASRALEQQLQLQVTELLESTADSALVVTARLREGLSEIEELSEGSRLSSSQRLALSERARELVDELESRRIQSLARIHSALPSSRGTDLSHFVLASEREYFSGLLDLHAATQGAASTTVSALISRFEPRLVVSEPRLKVFVQSVRGPLEPVGEIEALGESPLEVTLPPGRYRFVVTTPDQKAWSEHTRSLLQRNWEYELKAEPCAPAGVRGGSMVYISGQAALVGQRYIDSLDFYQEREVHVAAFWIDRHEVTCGEYQAFIRDTGQPAPLSWQGDVAAPEWHDLPVVGVRWDEAMAYAEWAGKRLPTWIEWQIAMRGPEGSRFPWGDELLDALESLSVVGRDRRLEWHQGVEPVRRSLNLDESYFGVFDGFGNVPEWTDTLFFNTDGEAMFADYTARITAGLSWNTSASLSLSLDWIGWGPYQASGIGFRCAKSDLRTKE